MKKAIFKHKGVEIYSPRLRFFHWLTVVFVVIQISLGLAMVERGVVHNVWDSITNFMYSSHKLMGVVILFVTLLRLATRWVYGVPNVGRTLGAKEAMARKWGHFTLYALLFLVAGLGYAGVVYFPARDVFNFFLPGPPVTPDEAFAHQIFTWHLWATYFFITLVVGHVGITMYHYRIRKDQVLGRMWPRFIRTEGGKKGKYQSP